MTKQIILFLLISFVHVNILPAQCSIEQNASTHSISVSTSDEIGQSFIACNSSFIELIKVNITNLNMTSINLQLTIAAGNNTMANVLHTQMVTVNNAGMLFIPLNKQISVTKGQTYTFSLVGVGSSSGNIEYAQTLGDIYTEGQMLRNNTGFSNFDLLFAVFIAAEPIIPTMSQWGSFIFGLLILNLGLLFVRQRELIYVLT